MTVTMKFPSRYAFQPDIFQRNYEFLSETKLRVWILDEWQWQTAKRQHDAFMRSLVKASYAVEYPPPFSRRRRKFETVCVPWKTELLFNISLKLLPKCPYEEGIITFPLKNILFLQYIDFVMKCVIFADTVEVIRFPAIMTGLSYGIVRTFQPYRDSELETGRQSMLHNPR